MSDRKIRSNRAAKVCVVCGRPFHWRKKWAKEWDQVRYCSQRCRQQRSSRERIQYQQKPHLQKPDFPDRP